MYLYDVKMLNKLQQSNAKFVIFSNGKEIVVKSNVFVPGANAKYIAGERK